MNRSFFKSLFFLCCLGGISTAQAGNSSCDIDSVTAGSVTFDVKYDTGGCNVPTRAGSRAPGSIKLTVTYQGSSKVIRSTIRANTGGNNLHWSGVLSHGAYTARMYYKKPGGSWKKQDTHNFVVLP